MNTQQAIHLLMEDLREYYEGISFNTLVGANILCERYNKICIDNNIPLKWEATPCIEPGYWWAKCTSTMKEQSR